MAKDRATSTSQPAEQPASQVGAGCSVDIHSLAADLFARNFIPRHDHIQPWKVAADCYAGAIEFLRVSRLIADGVDPSEIGPRPTETTESPAASQ